MDLIFHQSLLHIPIILKAALKEMVLFCKVPKFIEYLFVDEKLFTMNFWDNDNIVKVLWKQLMD